MPEVSPNGHVRYGAIDGHKYIKFFMKDALQCDLFSDRRYKYFSIRLMGRNAFGYDKFLYLWR